MEGAAQAGEPLRHRGFEFGAESFQLVGGKSAKEGLQDDFGFAEAGVEVVVEAIERVPSVAGLSAEFVGEFAGGFPELAVEALKRFGEEA